MQQLAPAKPTPLPRPGGPRAGVLGATALVALSGAIAGCGPTAATRATGPGTRQYTGVSLTVRCPDARLAAVLTPMARVWAARTGAAVEVVARPPEPGEAAGVAVLPFAELGAWADRGDLLPVPPALRDPGHPYQWTTVLGVYRGEPFAGWGEQLLGVPLAAVGHVLVYRADRLADPQAGAEFRKQFNRPLAAPATWEDFAEVAGFFAARDKKPSLPPLAADPARLADLFSRVAACYDRAAEGDTVRDPAAGAARPDPLAFHFRLTDGRPRLDTPGFRAAAGWLAGLKQRGCLPADGPADPAAALMDDRAVLAELTLEELTRLRKDGKADPRFGVAALPGTRQFADPKTGALIPAGGGNYVPYVSGGWIGVVRKGCEKPEAAFDLLAELGGPDRSLEVVAAGGYGPLRDTHLDRDRLQLWLGYGFDEGRSKALQDAVRAYVGKAVRNPTYGLRGPDQAALTAALGTELRRVAAGEAAPDEALKRAAGAWEKADAGTPPEKQREWRRRAAGLN